MRIGTSFGRSNWLSVVMVLSCAAAAACNHEESASSAAPSASALAPVDPPATMSQSFAVVADGSNVDFVMHAPVENIHGKAPGSMNGELFIDLHDLTKSRGLVKIDLAKLTLYQQKADDSGKFGEESKNDKQNEHARTWFQITDDAPADVRDQNKIVQFSIDKVATSTPDVASMAGVERKITAKVSGDLLLHGRRTRHTATVEVAFKYAGDRPASMTVKTTEPVAVSLEAHEIQPRETWEKLAAKTLDALGQKVAKEAPVSFQFTANAK